MVEPLIQSVSKVLIKPSSPTPESLRCYNLSSSDQTVRSTYIPLAFCYTNLSCESSRIRLQLENSLSKTLMHYYPFAGRLVENDHIDCNDEGVEFVEVRIHCTISYILDRACSSYEDLVFPRGMIARNEDSLVAVQLSRFDCGGVAIGICISHKVADASSLVSFMNDWAATTRLPSHIPSPLLVSDSIFQHLDNPLTIPIDLPQDGVTRRFIFPATEIEKLKYKAVESGDQQHPSRVEVVTALLYQCAIEASRSSPSSCALVQAVNLRPSWVPPLPRDSVGNILAAYVCITDQDDRTKLSKLVSQLRNGKRKLQDLAQNVQNLISQREELGECFKQLHSSSFHVYYVSSWCRFPVYEVDFGWGKPVRVFSVQYQVKDIIVLMDSPGNGIEASVTLGEETMTAFEQNEDLLSLVSISSAS